MDLRKSIAEAKGATGQAVVVCRTGAARRAALATLLQSEGGLEDVRVVTLAGLVHEGVPTPLVPQVRDLDALPDEHPWAVRLSERRLLRQLLRAHTEEAHRLIALGADPAGLPPEVRQLVAAGWSVPDDLPGWRAASALDPRSVVLFGFVGPQDTSFGGTLTGAARVLAAKLGAVATTTPPEPRDTPIAAILVADVIAEARRAVVEVGDAKSALVLVADAATGDRIRSAFRRNGIAVTDTPAVNLRHHALATVLESLVPVFERPNEAGLTQQEVFTLLSHPVLSRAPTKASLPAVKEAGGDRASRLSVRHCRRLLRGTRRFRASAAEWVGLVEASLSATGAHAGEGGEDKKSAETIAAQRITALIALGKLRAIEEAAGKGTFAAFADVVGALGLSQPTDAVGNAIRGGLRLLGAAPVSAECFDIALDGSVDAGRLPAGVAILGYDEYDGRAADVLVLADVHHKGVGSAPTPDPFLSGAGLTALRRPEPATVVRERLELARSAARRAARCLAIVTAHDASSRAVVPPVELNLVFAETAPSPDSYGLGLPLPENLARSGIESGVRDPKVAAQVDAEWVRAGWRLAGTPALAAAPEDEPAPTLALNLERYDARPDDLRPWLGAAGVAMGSGDGLPPGYVLSATKLERFTTCMYRAYAAEVLRLREPDELEEDVGARDVGTAAHAVLESAATTAEVRWIVPDQELDAARSRLLAATAGGIGARVVAVRDLEGRHEETAALTAAREGLTRRWARHWERYVDRRIGTVGEEARKAEVALAKELVSSCSAVAEAMIPGLAPTPRGALAKAIAAAVAKDPTEAGVRNSLRSFAPTFGKANGALLASALDRPLPPELAELLGPARARKAEIAPNPLGDGVIIAVEEGAAFGTIAVPAAMRLGRAAIPVTGRVDALVEWTPVQGPSSLDVVDFKTGKKTPGTAADVLKSFAAPQLVFYALAARHELLEAARGKAVGAVAYDMVVSLDNPRHPIDAATLDRAEATFGALLDRARDGDYPLAPLAASCPLIGNGYCDYQEICRVRALPKPDPDEAGETQGAGA